MNTRYLDLHEVDLAQAVSKGEVSPEGFRVLTPSEYFKRPLGMCCHPQGWPCFKSCIVDSSDKKTTDLLDLRDSFEEINR